MIPENGTLSKQIWEDWAISSQMLLWIMWMANLEKILGAPSMWAVVYSRSSIEAEYKWF